MPAGAGRHRYQNMQNRVESGRAYSFYRDSLTGLSIATIYTRYDSGVTDTGHQFAQHERDNYGKKQDYGTLFTGTEAWDVTYPRRAALCRRTVSPATRKPRSTTSSIFFACDCTSPAGSSNPRAPT